MNELTQLELKKVLDYNPNTGIFVWRLTRSPMAKAKDVAGTAQSKGYWQIMYNYRRYLAHRLAFLYMTGSIPTVVDHRDQNKLNNRWENLRPAAGSKNQHNVGLRSNNSTGFKGVSYHKGSGKFQAKIGHKGKRIFIGRFDTAEAAALAYNEKAFEIHGEFACLNNMSV